MATEKIPTGNGKPATPPGKGNAGRTKGKTLPGPIASPEVFVRAWKDSKTKAEVVTRLKAAGFHVTLSGAQQRAGMMRKKGVKLPSFGYGGRGGTDVAALNAILAEGKGKDTPAAETVSEPTEPVSMSAPKDEDAQDVPGRVEKGDKGEKGEHPLEKANGALRNAVAALNN